MGKRRTCTAKFKANVVLAIMSGRQSAAEVCREHQIKPQVISRWKSDFVANAAQVFENKRQRRREAERVAKLERLVGQQALELTILKKVTGSWS